MYGDNRNILMAGGAVLVMVLLLTLSLTSLVKVSRLEKVLTRNFDPSEAPFSDNKNDTSQDESYSEELISREQAFFEALNYWDKKQKILKESENETPLPDPQEWEFLEGLGLSWEPLSQKGLLSIFEKKADVITPLIRVEIHKNEILLTPVEGETVIFSSLNNRAIRFIEQESLRLKQEALFYDESAQLFFELSGDSSLLSLLKRRACLLIPETRGELIASIKILTLSEEKEILSLTYDRQGRYINNLPISGTPLEYTRQVFDQLEKADTRPLWEIEHQESLTLIRTMYGDKAFVDFLEERGLFPQWNVREDNDFSYIDLLDREGQFTAAFAVKKRSGRIYLVDDHDIPLISLQSLEALNAPLPNDGIQILSTPIKGIYDPQGAGKGAGQGSFTILLVGYHNSGTDTMILAHINGEQKKISLISIPRDLWWENQKINSYYFGSSRQSLLDLMTKITGVKVDYYLSIDMYAFIDVVNAMGGVDITLETSVIDPTYRIIRKDGTEGTLYYTPGTYHLDGVEALRLARSRHGSSDFDRSALQQQILSSMKDKISHMSLKDTPLFKQFLNIGLENGETNMSLSFMVKNLIICRDYTLDGGNTLYDKSILYNSYSNFYNLSPSEREKARIDEDFNWGQWILLPVNNDWNLIKIRVREILGVE